MTRHELKSDMKKQDEYSFPPPDNWKAKKIDNCKKCDSSVIDFKTIFDGLCKLCREKNDKT